MDNNHILTEIREDGVATVTLNRAEVHNAFNDTVIADLTGVLRRLGDDDKVRAVVLRAEGKSFSAGADLGWMQRMAGYGHAENLADAGALAELMRVLNFLPKPTVARVQGAAFGGGVGLVACCDIAIASDAASFSLSEVRLGLIPAVISPYVVAAIGERAARRYFLTAERFDADEALRIGLVHQVVPADQLDSAVDDHPDPAVGGRSRRATRRQGPHFRRRPPAGRCRPYPRHRRTDRHHPRLVRRARRAGGVP